MLAEGVLTLLLVGAGANPPPAPLTPSPYLVTIDITDAVHALGSDDLFVSEPAAQQIVALGVAAVPVLSAALQRESPQVRAGIAEVLGSIGEPECLAPLLGAARDRSAAVRAAALGSLGELAEPASAAVVEQALNDSDAKVRLAAVGACGEVCSSQAAFARIAVLAMREPSNDMLPRAREALRKILNGKDSARGAAARQAVAAAVAAELRQSAPTRVRVRAALLALDLGEDNALAVLRQALRESDDRSLKLAAIFTLTAIGTDEAASIIVEQARDPLLGPAACQALRQLAAKNPAVADQAGKACPAAAPAGASRAHKEKGPETMSPALE